MRKYVQFYIECPEGVSEKDFKEWLLFKLGASGGMGIKNPMADQDLEASNVNIMY